MYNYITSSIQKPLYLQHFSAPLAALHFFRSDRAAFAFTLAALYLRPAPLLRLRLPRALSAFVALRSFVPPAPLLRCHAALSPDKLFPCRIAFRALRPLGFFSAPLAAHVP
ncbi:MAG TPA: hypothetical protein H9692_03725 [Firmicutes bacterium]|nr:hypothetical protein [Bacillota bacterium]